MVYIVMVLFRWRMTAYAVFRYDAGGLAVPHQRRNLCTRSPPSTPPPPTPPPPTTPPPPPPTHPLAVAFLILPAIAVLGLSKSSAHCGDTSVAWAAVPPRVRPDHIGGPSRSAARRARRAGLRAAERKAGRRERSATLPPRITCRGFIFLLLF